MKTLLKSFLMSCLMATSLVFLPGCDDDDNAQPQLTGDSKTYDLSAVANSGITGTVTFAERDDDMVVITLQLTGSQSGDTYPAHIHANSAAEGGSIVLSLAAVEGASGKSETAVNAFDDGTTLTYDELLAFDGHVNVHRSAVDLTIVAQADIGRNELTGEEEVITLTPVADPAVSGTVTFAKRQNGNTLVTVELENTQPGASHPSHIHANTIAEGGGIVIDLNNVDGSTGMASTDVTQLNDGTPITYEELLDFNGYLNVHTGSTFVVQGDIGQNVLIGDKVDYALNELNGSGVSGTATFTKRKSGKALITLLLTGTSAGGDHPAHIHANDAATGGGIVLDLENVNGETGTSATSVSVMNDATPVSYDELIAYDGHINVHLSPTELATRIAQGNIGSNVP